MKKLLEELLVNQVPTSVINENKPVVNDLHPTMKPIKLLARLIKNSSLPKENVIDLKKDVLGFVLIGAVLVVAAALIIFRKKANE